MDPQIRQVRASRRWETRLERHLSSYESEGRRWDEGRLPPAIGNAAREAGASVVKHALFADRARYARYARDAVPASSRSKERCSAEGGTPGLAVRPGVAHAARRGRGGAGAPRGLDQP